MTILDRRAAVPGVLGGRKGPDGRVGARDG